MEFLVDVTIDTLNEQFFNPTIQISRINGEANVEWTGCFERRCDHEKNKYTSELCKEYCKIDAAQEALGRIRGLLGFCKKAKNPRSCANTIRKKTRLWDKRIATIDNRIAFLKRSLAKYNKDKMVGEK